MKQMNRKTKSLGVAILLLLLLTVPTVILAQEEEPICNPAASRLAEVMGMGTDCQDLVDLRAEGYGLGEIMKAWYLAKDLDGFGDWHALLEQRQAEGLGWGQFKMASRLASGGVQTPAQLLQLKQDGAGWGQIKKAQAMEAAGLMSFSEALARFQSGAGWDDLGLGDGPPPWAGPKDKDRGGNGPPAWANNDKNDQKNGE